VDVATFADVHDFNQKVDDPWQVMKPFPALPGVDEVQLPGERSAQGYLERMAHGDPPGAELRQLPDELADRMGIQRLQSEAVYS
jgi:LDH2 family malate/lactate/ureidoglycolate dehydrogenase